uniref:Uncharacterized protein n=1 Tax=uncultured marine group II/III euryarchaeote KM3_139_C07 TaxID=1457870 RepID=A0A075G9T5_9EURY|nr:hypothetical protein [uncultured marine group II/III euryarchaeote KM3_139_C07]
MCLNKQGDLRLQVFHSKKRMKKGQAAMEFLMTYGWAILVVIIAITALASFGVLRPGKLLPTSCTFEPGISCDDSYITPSSFLIVVTNGLGQDVVFRQFTLISPSESYYSNETDIELSDGQRATYLLNITQEVAYLTVGSRASFDMKIEYSKKGSPLNRTLNGRIVGLVHED